MTLYLFLIFFGSCISFTFSINVQANNEKPEKFEIVLRKFFVPLNRGLSEEILSKQYVSKTVKSIMEQSLVFIPLTFFLNKFVDSIISRFSQRKKIRNLIDEYTMKQEPFDMTELELEDVAQSNGFEEVKDAIARHIDEDKNDGLFYIYGLQGTGKTTAVFRIINYLLAQNPQNKKYRFINLSSIYQNCVRFELPEGCPGILEEILEKANKNDKTIIFVDELKEFLYYPSIKKFLLNNSGSGDRGGLPNHIIFIGTGNEHLASVNVAINDRFFSTKFRLNKKLCCTILEKSLQNESLQLEDSIDSYLRLILKDLQAAERSLMEIYNYFNTDESIGIRIHTLESICEKYSDKEKKYFVFSLRSMNKVCEQMKSRKQQEKIDYDTFKNTIDDYFFDGIIDKTEKFIKFTKPYLLKT